MPKGEDRIVRFTGRGYSIANALENVTTHIINAVLCGTFSRAQLGRMHLAITKRIGRENYDRDYPNTG